MTIEPAVPASHADLLERALFAHLATVRPDGSPQSNVMWFLWADGRIKMTHTKSRQKFRNFAHEPRVAISIADPDDPYRFLEIRGVVETIDDDDPQASFYQSLQQRYGQRYPITDAPVRVIVTIRPTSFIGVASGRLAQHS